MKDRLYYISFLQFVGPIFVIFGHSMNGIAMNSAMLTIKEWVYVFHMPLFFFMSGYLFSYKGGFDRYTYKEAVKKKAVHLLIPYGIWNLAFLIPKIVLVDYSQLSMTYLLNILLIPKANILGHTWFLFALFEIYVLSYGLDYLTQKKTGMIIGTLFFVLLNCFQVKIMVLCVNDLMRNLLYFWLGMLLAKGRLKAADRETERGKLLVALFAALAVTSTVVWHFYSGMKVIALVLCTSVLMGLFYLPIAFNIKHNFFEYASKNSFSIYVLHWPCIVVVRYIVYKTLNFSAMMTFITLMLLGWLLPIMIIEMVKRITFLKNIKGLKYILGI